MSNLDSFLTGFLNTTTGHIKKRKDDADEYFNSRLELARTRGLKNKDMTKRVIDGNVAIAKQLQQVGVPSDVVMAIAKQNPDDLGGVLSSVQKLQEEGVPVNEAFYRDLITVSDGYKPPNQDMATFISNLYTPLSNNAQSDPATFQDAPKDSIWATMLGTNAMSRASDKLDRTEVADGLTAGELLRYGDEPLPDTSGAPTVTIDAALTGDSVRAARDARDPQDNGLRINDIKTLDTEFEERYDRATLAIKEAYINAHPEFTGGVEDIPDYDRNASVIAINEMLELYDIEDLREIPKIARIIDGMEEQEDAVTTEALPPEVGGEAAGRIPVSPTVDTPVAPEAPIVEPGPPSPRPSKVPATLSNGDRFHRVLPATGDQPETVIFITPKGELKRYPMDAVADPMNDPLLQN